MQEYISKQQQVLRPAEQIYAVISRFDNLTPALADKVEEWQATEDSCSFKAKGFTVKLRMEEREPGKYVKVVGDDGGVPMDFAFWIQLQEVSAADTRLRLVLRIDLNMMMKMMIGNKLQGALDQIAEGIARADERRPARSERTADEVRHSPCKSGTVPQARCPGAMIPGGEEMFAAHAGGHAAKGGMTPCRRLRQGSRKHSSARRAHENL